MIRLFFQRFLAIVPAGLALLAALGIVVGSIGFPMPPVGGGAFPCQGHGCGCGSAQACWLGCCCLTPAQRLAWAKENGVTVPPEFLASLEIAEQAQRARAKVASARSASCCRTGTTSCCATDANCCSGESEADTTPATDGEPGANSDEQPTQLCAGRCHGPGQWWIAGGQPLALPVRAVGVGRSNLETGLSLDDSRYDADRDTPPTRPG